MSNKIKSIEIFHVSDDTDEKGTIAVYEEWDEQGNVTLRTEYDERGGIEQKTERIFDLLKRNIDR